MQPTGPAKGGIHDIAINNNTGLLATGAMNPDHIALYDTADMSARAILEGHTDWVFALQWLDQNTLISGSRDHTVALWSVDSDASVRPHPLMEDVNVYAPKFRFKEDRDHSNKVRDMRLAPGKQLLTLYCDGVLNTWDMERFQITSSLQLAYQQETCCMALKEDDPHYIAIGSNKYVSFMDIRAPDSTLAIPSVDEMWGVRSLSFNGNIATVGGGKGRVSFFDLRARKYLSLCQEESHECLDHHHHENEAPNVHRVHEHEHTNTNIRDSVRYSDMRGQDRIVSVGVPHRRRRVPVKNLRNRGSILVQDDIKAGYLEVSKGWIDANTQDDHMFPGGWPIAVYAHAYDPTGTRLFTAGGPLQVTRSGSFASLWY
jgi:WD repeat-containing protein 40A